jgi:dipeptidyl aminopeptidase/acylaminoacyl peptidase
MGRRPRPLLRVLLLTLIAAFCAFDEGATGELAAEQAALHNGLVITREHELVAVDAAGAERVLLRTPVGVVPLFPAWSPDGARIAFVLASFPEALPVPGDGDDIYLVDADGRATTRVWEHDAPEARVHGLAWSPDGTALLFGYQRYVYDGKRFQGVTRRIERLDIATGARRVVVEDALSPSVARGSGRLVYLGDDAGGRERLWTAMPDGSDARVIAEVDETFLFVIYPRVSPDGRVVVFATPSLLLEPVLPPPLDPAGLRMWLAPSSTMPVTRPAAHGIPMDLWRIDLEDSATRRLTSLAADDPYAAWSPDGTTLTFIATEGLFQLGADGRGIRRIGEGAFGGHVDVR